MEANITTNIYVCENCGKSGIEKLRKCGRCKISYYCSSECQKVRWDSHKLECSDDEDLNAIKSLVRKWETDKDDMYFKLFDRYKEFCGCHLLVKNPKLFLRGIAEGKFITRTHVPERTHVMVAGAVRKLSEKNHAYSVAYYKDRDFMIGEIEKMKDDMGMQVIDLLAPFRKYMAFTVLGTNYTTFWSGEIVI